MAPPILWPMLILMVWAKACIRLPSNWNQSRGPCSPRCNPARSRSNWKNWAKKPCRSSKEVKQNPPTGYQVASVLLSPDRCLVRGAAEAVARVTGVVAPLDLGSVKDIATVKSTLQAIDADGKVISEGIQIVPATINVVGGFGERSSLAKKSMSNLSTVAR